MWAPAAKRRQSSTLVSTGSPSLDRNSITSATASPKVFSSASSSHASRTRALIRTHSASSLQGVERQGCGRVEHGGDRRLFPLPQRRHGFGGLRQNAPTLQPLPGDGVLSGRYGVQEMGGEVGDRKGGRSVK